MLTKKLSKHGNSWALIIDKPILELLGIDENTPLELKTDGKQLIVFPQAEETTRERLFGGAEEFVFANYDGALAELAK